MTDFFSINVQYFAIYFAGVVYIGTESMFPATRLQQMIKHFKDKYSQGPASYTDHIFVHHIPDMVIVSRMFVNIFFLHIQKKNMREELHVKLIFSNVCGVIFNNSASKLHP